MKPSFVLPLVENIFSSSSSNHPYPLSGLPESSLPITTPDRDAIFPLGELQSFQWQLLRRAECAVAAIAAAAAAAAAALVHALPEAVSLAAAAPGGRFNGNNFNLNFGVENGLSFVLRQDVHTHGAG